MIAVRKNSFLRLFQIQLCTMQNTIYFDFTFCTR